MLHNAIENLIKSGSCYLQKQYQDLTNDDSTIWKIEWLRNHPEALICSVLIYFQENFISKGTIEICRTPQRSDGSRNRRLWNNEEFCKNVSDLISPTEMKRKPKTILIEGASGIGKTILVTQIASQWKFIRFICKKDFVFLLNLWDPKVNEISTVYGMTEYFFKDHFQASEIGQIERYIHETNGSCLAIVLDGYKENSIKNTFFIELAERKSLIKCSVIITSHPLDCKKLHFCACRRVEMLGFDGDYRDDYLKRVFQNSPHEYDLINKHMQSNPSIDRLCCIPLNITFLVYLLNCKFSLPTTQTEYFERFICIHFGMFDNLTQLKSKHGKALKELAKYSFELLSNDKMMFSMEDLMMNCPNYSTIKQSNSCLYDLLLKAWRFPAGDTAVSNRFIYSRIQEYLAAYYLSQLSWFDHDYHEFNAIFDGFFLKHGCMNMWILFFDIIKGQQKFFDQFGNKIIETIGHDGAKGLLPYDKVRFLYLFECFKEADNNELCTKIRDSLGDEMDFTGHQMLPQNMITLCLIMTQSLQYCHLKMLDLTNCEIGDAGCKYFYKQLQLCFSSCALTIDALILSNNQLTASSINQVVNLTLQLKVKILDLSNNHFCGEAKQLINNRHHFQLTFLNLVNNNIPNIDELAKVMFYTENTFNFSVAFTKECLFIQQDCISNFTEYNTSVRSLFLDCSKVPNEHQVERFLQEAKSLEVIHLLTQSSFDVRVLNHCKLKEVYISQLNDDYAYRLVNGLPLNSTILVTSQSTLHASNVQNAAMTNYALKKCKTQSINEIHIDSCTFDIECFAEALASKEHFTVVRIMDCDIGDKAMQYLCERRCFTTIDELHLFKGSFKSVDYLKKLVAYWKVQLLYVTNRRLSCNDIKEITSYIKVEHLELEVLSIKGFAYSVDELDDVCESLFLDPKYSVDLSFINANSVIIKRTTKQNINLIIEHVNESEHLKLYLTESNLQSEYLLFEYLSNVKDNIVLQKLYFDAPSVNIENLHFILEKHRQQIKCLYLSVDTLPDENFDNIVKKYFIAIGIPVWIMSNTRVLAKGFILKNPITFCAQNISSLSLNDCTFNEETLANLVKSLTTYRIDLLDLSHCKLDDLGIKFIWSQLEHSNTSGNASIEALHLSGNNISHHSVVYLTNIVSKLEVDSFCGSSNSLMRIGIEKFVTYATKSNINYIDLLDNKASSIKEFCKSTYFSSNNQLNFLVTNNGIIIAKNFCKVLTKESVIVESLYICNSMPEHTSDCKHFSAHLVAVLNQTMQSLQSLYIINHSSSAINFEELKLYLFPNLHHVYVEIISLPDELSDQLLNSCKTAGISTAIVSKSQVTGFKADEDMILQALYYCNTTDITSIKLTACKVDQLTKNIGTAISSCIKTWEVICLKDCDISDSHIAEIYSVIINSNAKVIELDLSANKLTASCLELMGRITQMLKTEVLNIEENYFTDEIVSGFADFIESSQIQHLYMQGNTQVADHIGQMLCETMIFNDDCKIKFAQVTENIAFINGSVIGNIFCETTKQNHQHSIYFKTTFYAFKQVKYINAVEQFKILFTSLHVLRYLCIVIMDKDFYEDLFQLLVMNVQKIENLIICAENMSDSLFSDFIENKNLSYSVGIMSQKRLFVANANEKVLNYILDHKYLLDENVTDIFLSSCELKNEKSFCLLAESLVATCKNIDHLTLKKCALKDVHISQCQNALKQTSKALIIKKLDLSSNCLQSFNVIKLCYLLQTEELVIANNQIQIKDTTLITKTLTDITCHLNYIDLQNNLIANVEDVCKKLFFALYFNFNLTVVDQGCIFSQRLNFKIHSESSIKSFFFAFKDPLSDQDFQDFFQVVKPSTVNKLFVAMFQNENWCTVTERIKFLIVIEELYLCIPDMDDDNVDHFWQYNCKSKLLLSTKSIKAVHIQDSEILCRTFDYVTADLHVIELENSSVCQETMKKIALVISNNTNDIIWKTFKLCNCNISDNHINIFYNQYNEHEKQNNILVKSVDLSKNKISQSVVKQINQLLEQWKTEELNIAENDLQRIGIQQLIQNDNIFMHLHILDTQQNNVQYTNEEVLLLCEDIIFNKPIVFMHLTSSVLIMDGNAFSYLHNHEVMKKEDVSSIYFKFKIPEQERLLPNIQRYLSSLHSLDSLSIVISGNIADNKLIRLSKKVSSIKQLIIWAESLSENNFNSFIKHFKPIHTIYVSSRQNLYIANSNDEMVKHLINNVSRLYENMTSVTLNSCKLHKNSDSTELLLKALINGKEKEYLDLLAINNCALEYEHIHELCTTLTDKLKSISLNITVLDLSNNYLNTKSILDLIKIVSNLQTEELILNNNSLEEEGVKAIIKFLTDENCHLRYIDLQNNHIHNMDEYFNSFFFSCDFSFSIITTSNGCIITRRLMCFRMQHAKVNSVYLSIREVLASDPDLQELLKILMPSSTLNKLYVTILQHTLLSPYHVLKTIECLALLVSTELYLCIPEMDSVSAEKLLKHHCSSKIILARNVLQIKNITNSKFIFNTLDHINNTNNIKIWERLEICGCDFTDDHAEQLCETSVEFKNTGNSTLIKSINFSDNKISSSGLETIIKLVELWKSEKLILAKNCIQYSGLQTLLEDIASKNVNSYQIPEANSTHSLKILNSKDCYLNYVDLQSNFMSNVEDLCKQYFFILNFQFTFMIAKNGIIMMKDFDFDLQLIKGINSLYLAVKEVLPEQGLQILLQTINKSPKVTRLYMYFTMLHNKGLVNVIKAATSPTVTEEFYICVPDMDDDNAKKCWQFLCKSNIKVLLSKHTLQASNENETVTLRKTFDYITADLNNISLTHSSLCVTTLKLLATVISNDGNSKIWNTLSLCNCNVTDDHVKAFFKQFTQCKKEARIVIKSVNFSSNKISSSVVRETTNLLQEWESEDFIIAGNNLQYSGLAQLVTARNMRINTLDARQNKVQPCSIEYMTQMFEDMTFNHSFNFTLAYLTEDVLMIDASFFNDRHLEVKRKSDILSVYIKGTFSTSDLEVKNIIYNMQTFVSSFSHLENLFIAIQGDITFDDGFLEHLKDTNLTKQFILYAESMSRNIYMSFVESSYVIGILLRQKCHIANSDGKLLNNMLNNMAKHCKNMTIICIHNCTMSSYSFELLAKGLICTSKKLTEVSMNGCKVEDGHIKHFYEILKESYEQTKAEFLTIKILQLSNNSLKSLLVIELVCMLKTEELYLNDNQIQGSDIKCVLDALRNENCLLKFITVQNNHVSNVDDLCKKYYFEFDFNFVFVIMKNGVVIMKDLLFDTQFGQNINSLYLTIREVLPEQFLQQIMDTLPKNLNKLYITILTKHYKNVILNVKSVTVNYELYLCVPDMDMMSANEFWQYRCKSKLVLSKHSFQAAHILLDDTEMLFKTFKYNAINLNAISLENVSLSYTAIKMLAAIISNDGNDKKWNTLKLCNCNITDDHVQCFYEQFIQCKKQGKIQVDSVDFSHNKLSSIGMRTIIKLLQQWKNKELMITGNTLQYNGLVALVHAIVSESCSVFLQKVDVRLNNVQCSREQIAQLCELIVFNNSCSIKYAIIEDFLIMDGNDLESNFDITNVSSVCFTGNISASRQNTFLTNVKELLSCQKSSLANLYFLMPEKLSLDESIFNTLKKVMIAKKLVINVKCIPSRSFVNTFIKHFEESFEICILSEQNLYISNSDEKLLLYILNHMNLYYKSVTWISINRCPLSSGSQYFDLLVMAMASKDKKVNWLALTQCEIGYNEIMLLQKNFALSHKKYDYTNFTIEAIDLSNNCLESDCRKSLIELTSTFKLKEMILTHNKFQMDDIITFMDHLYNRDSSIKFIDFQENCLENLDSTCKNYFLNHHCELGFFLAEGGIILTKSLSYNVLFQQNNKLSGINALFVKKITTLTSEDFYALTSYLNLGMQLNILYIVLHENENLPDVGKGLLPMSSDQNDDLYITEKDLNFLLPSRDLYVYAPKVIKVDVWWQHECNSKFVLSKQAMQAINITDSVVLYHILDNSSLIKTLTIIKFVNCSLHSDSLLTKLAQALCSGDDLKVFQNLELCNCCIDDSDIKHFCSRFAEFSKTKFVTVKRVNLSYNAITPSAVQIIINLLKNWKSEELVITGNSLNFDGLQDLVNATKEEINTLKVLDAQENSLSYLEGERLSKAWFFDSASSICYVRVKSKSTVKFETFDSIVIKQMHVNKFAIQIDTIEDVNLNTNFWQCLFTDTMDNIILNLLNGLKPTIVLKKLCLLEPIAQQQILPNILRNNPIQELHLYIYNMTKKQIQQYLPRTCTALTILSATSFEAKESNCSYIKGGILLVLQQSHDLLGSLNDVSFTCCKLDEETLHLLHEMVWNCKHSKVWENIDLSHCELGDKLELLLKSPISRTQCEVVVKSIDLSFNNLSSAAINPIINIALSCQVQFLNISYNNFQDDGVEKLSEFLINSSQLMDGFSLKTLKMEKNSITYPTAETFASMIHKKFHRKQFLLCIDHVLLVQETKVVPKGIKLDYTVKSFYCFNCNIKSISSFKHCFENIENVGICNNYSMGQSQVNAEDLIKEFDCGVSIVVALQDVLIAKNTNASLVLYILEELASLEVMDFENCEITSEILKEIVRLLPINKPLNKLSINACNFAKDGCEILLQLLTVANSEVVSLSCSSNLIESHMDFKIIFDVSSHLKVSELYLTNNNLEDGDIRQFAEILNTMNHMITTIDFRGNHTCNMTEGEFMHIGNCKLHVFITEATKLYFENDHKLSTDSDDKNIKYLYFIKYVFTNEFEELLSYSYLKKFHLVGKLNMGSKRFVRIIQGIQADEILIVAKNFTRNQAFNLFNSASCSIIIAIEGAILGKNCINGELINTALEYATFSHFTKVHFSNCEIADIEKTITKLLQFYKHSWKDLEIEHCNIDDNACINLAHTLSSAETIVQSVNFSSNFLTSSSTEAVVKIINNSKVSKLCLSNNKFSVEDVECILNTVMMTYNMQEISYEENGIDELQLIHMIKHKFLSFEFDCIYDISGLYYNCHILAYGSPKRCYFYRFFIDSCRSNVSTIYDSEFQIDKLFINTRTLLSLQLLENDLCFLSGTISEIYTIVNCTLSNFNEQQLIQQASMSIKLILSNETIKSLDLLQSQTDNQLPCLTILVSHQVGNTEGMLSKLVSSMPEISFVHILVTKVADVNNVIETVLKDLLNITSIKMFELHIKEGAGMHHKIISEIIVSNKKLEALNLSDNNLEPDEFSQITMGIQYISSLQSINFSNNRIIEQGRNSLLVIFINNQCIKEINISNNSLRYLKMKRITKLTMLDLSYTCLGIDEDGIKHLKEIMDSNMNLETLNISGNSIGDEIESIMLPSQNEMLRFLNISNNEITYKGARFISVVISQNPLLQELDVSNNPLSSKNINNCGITIILQALQAVELPHMKSLNLSYTGNTNKATTANLSKTFTKFLTLEKINISGVAANISTILKSIENMSSLKALILENCNIGYKEANILSTLVICKNANLQVLNVNNNSIMNKGFISILKALLTHHVSHIKTLNISNINIELDKLIVNVDTTKDRKLHLEHLDISNNKFKETAILSLLTNFIDVRSLKTLNINCYELKGECNLRILNHLANSATKLEFLSISGYIFTSDKLEQFVKHIHLTHIDISYCGITNDVATQIVENDVFKFGALNSLNLSGSGLALPLLHTSIKNIHTIKLQKCNISINTIDALTSYDSTICVLHLCHNNLANTRRAQVQIAERLADCLANPLKRSLKELCLQNCDLSTIEALAIIKALRNNSTLKCLNLSNNRMLYKPFCSQLRNVEDALRENRCLEQFSIVGNNMEPSEIANVMLSCAECSHTISKIELPFTTSEEEKARIIKHIKSINNLRVIHKSVPLCLAFFHISHFEH